MKKLCYILLCGLLVLLASCEKDTMAGIFAPEVTTGTATNIYRKGATLSGSIRFSEGTVAEHYGILFSELQSMSEYKEMKVEDGATDYNIPVQDLEPGKTYYFCSYAHSGYSLRYGEIRSFTTPKSNAPVFEALVASSQTVNSFKVTATLLDDGGSELIMVGFCYNEFGEKEPTFLDKVVNVAPEGDSFSAELTGLEPGKQYQVRVYGASENGLAYSDILIVSTEQAVVPYLSSISCQDSTATSITVSASVIDAGTSSVKELGFCYSSESQEPTKESHKSIDLSDQKNNDVFSTIIGDLIAGTTYYIRAYAVNTEGISYSDAVSYMPRSEVPTLSEISCQDSTATTITVKASVLTEGTSAIKSVGFCYSTESQEPTKELHSYIELPSHWNTAEEFIGTLESLESNTTYYIRAYAENSEGIGYSESISYTPYAEVPTLSTITTKDEKPTSITVSASVLNIGTSAVTAIGFRYKAEGQENETVVDLSDQLGNELFSVNLEELEPGTTYNIRAYAENSEGVGYSESISYTPYAEVPTLSAITTKDEKPTSIIVSASVLNIGTSDVNAIGFRYKVEGQEDETIIDLSNQLGNELFSVSIEELEPGTTYNIRAYAENSEGVGYSESISYTPIAKVPVLSEVSAINETSASITVSASVLDMGTSNIKSVGFCYKAEGQEIETVIELSSQVNNENFSCVINGLETGTAYYIRAYAENDEGIGYSELISYTIVAEVPTLSIVSLSDATSNSIMASASVLDVGSSAIKSVGFCYKAEGQESEMIIDLSNQISNENFSATIEGLEAGITYIIRAYAENGEGMGYSNEVSYTPIADPGIYSLEDWIEFCAAKETGSTDMSKWKNSEGVINLYTDLDFSNTDYDKIILRRIDANETLNGNNHVVSGFYIMADFNAYFIWYNEGTIMNLHLGDGTIQGGLFSLASVSGFCYENSGTIMDCSSKVNVIGTASSAGICVSNSGSIIRCTNWGNVETDSYDYYNAAGIALDGTIVDCKNYGNITGGNAAGIGGTVVSNSINYGTIGFNPEDEYSLVSTHAAGISISTSVEGCINEGRVHASECSGGIVAYLSDELKVNNCSNKGDITSDGYCGGIIGLIKKTSIFYIAGCLNTNGGTINGAIGDETNAIGYDERTGNPSIDDLPTVEWEYGN